MAAPLEVSDMKLWNHSLVVGLLVAGMFGSSAGAQAPRAAKAVELGSIDFPTSAKPAARRRTSGANTSSPADPVTLKKPLTH